MATNTYPPCQHASEADNAGIDRVIQRWIQIKTAWKDLKDSGIYPDLPWADLEAIHKARLDKQTYPIHWVADALRPDRCGRTSKLPASVFDTVRRYCRKHLSAADADLAFREFTHFRMKSGGPLGVSAMPDEDAEPLFAASSLVYDDNFKPSEAWRCLLVQGSILARLAVRVLDTLSNSVPSERSFSANNTIHSITRNRLTAERADQQTFVFMNSRVLERLAHSGSLGHRRWADLEEKDWIGLEDTYLDLFLSSQGDQTYMAVGDQWHGVLQNTGDVVALGTELADSVAEDDPEDQEDVASQQKPLQYEKEEVEAMSSPKRARKRPRRG